MRDHAAARALVQRESLGAAAPPPRVAQRVRSGRDLRAARERAGMRLLPRRDATMSATSRSIDAVAGVSMYRPISEPPRRTITVGTFVMLSRWMSSIGDSKSGPTPMISTVTFGLFARSIDSRRRGTCFLLSPHQVAMTI
jgi:hypothetical protein